MADYAYTNARIRAMQGRLFNRAGYESLLAQPTLTDALDALTRSTSAVVPERTDEKERVKPETETWRRLDEALRQDLVLSLSKLRRITSDRARDLLELLEDLGGLGGVDERDPAIHELVGPILFRHGLARAGEIEAHAARPLIVVSNR